MPLASVSTEAFFELSKTVAVAAGVVPGELDFEPLLEHAATRSIPAASTIDPRPARRTSDDLMAHMICAPLDGVRAPFQRDSTVGMPTEIGLCRARADRAALPGPR